MIIVQEVARRLKTLIDAMVDRPSARPMAMRMVLAFILHSGRMSCSQAAGAIASHTVYRGELTRFLATQRWRRQDLNSPLRQRMLAKESARGRFVFIIDATMVTQAGKRTQNTYRTGNRGRRLAQGRRYSKRKVVYKTIHSFTFGLLITPSGTRIPLQIPHLTKEYCSEHGLQHRTTAEAAAEMIRTLPLPEGADVVVLGDTAYDAQVVRRACAERGYLWIFPANSERVFEGPRGERPKLRTRLKDWTSLSLKTLRLRASTGRYADYRRLSKWRLGPKLKPRVYYAFQEVRAVRSVGTVQLVFSTMKQDLAEATPDDVKLLMTNATKMCVSEVLELYALRWQIELFFKELKSTLGFAQYSFIDFRAVEAWVELAITTALYLEDERASRLRDRRLSAERRAWWAAQRLHGLCQAFRQETAREQLRYIEKRTKTKGGLKHLQSLLAASIQPEYRLVG